MAERRADTPDAIVEYAVAEFNKLHPDVKVRLERQQWTGIVERLTTALSGNDAPDIVEFGNTQAQAFEAAGAVVDLTDKSADLGGDDFLQSLLEAGTYDGQLYAVPYYAGARIMIYRKDLFEASGIEIPTTLDEMVAAGEQLKADNADVPNFSGIYLPGRNWHAAMSFVWEHGGDIATQEGDQWVGQLDSPESIAGLEFFKDLFDRGQRRARRRRRRQRLPGVLRRRGRHDAGAGLEAGPDHQRGRRLPGDGGEHRRVRHARHRGRHDRPGLPRRLEHRHPDQQREPGAGLRPAQDHGVDRLPEAVGRERPDPGDQVRAGERHRQRRRRRPGRGGRRTAASCRRSENWAGVEAANVLQDMLVRDRPGRRHRRGRGQADAAIESTLNG